MYTHQDRILKQLIAQLDGLPKLEVYDLLSILETLLLQHPSPIAANKLLQHYEQHIVQKRSIQKTGKGCFYLYDRCMYLKIYKYHSFRVPNIFYRNALCFSLLKKIQCYPLTKQNLRKHLTHPAIQPALITFFAKHKPTARNPITKRLLLMEVLDSIDPE